MLPNQLNIVITDPVDLSAYSPSYPAAHSLSHNYHKSCGSAIHRSLHFPPSVKPSNMDTEAGGECERYHSIAAQAAESDPLLTESQPKKPFYRARPLWLVPFAISAAVARGMTLAPRIEVFTQLSCNTLHAQHGSHPSHSLSLLQTNSSISPSIDAPFYSSLDPLGPHLHPSRPRFQSILLPSTLVAAADDDEEDPRRLPSNRCLGDPAVQAGAARLQATMTTMVGLLSALTTGWWGHFGERYGRTKVLASATFGLFLTDLIFILVSTPGSPLASHGHKLIFLAPIIEGLLGGWSTFQSATSAYLSDCTSSGSRALIFSRFSGVFYFGFSVGPGIGGYLIRNPIWTTPGARKTPMVTSVFWVAVVCSFVNFILVLLVFPESLDKVKRERAVLECNAKAARKGRAITIEADATGEASNALDERIRTKTAGDGIVRDFLRPLRVFLPVMVMDGGIRKRRDWSLTLLGAAFFVHTLSQGVHQMKYLYAGHVYAWGVEQLSYYISFLGGARAVCLLFLLPSIIAALKPRMVPPNTPPSTNTTTKNKKSRPIKAHLAQEIKFDLLLTRCSFMIELLSNTFVTVSPMPSYKVHGANASSRHSKEQSQTLFVLATSLSSLGSGAVPAIQSLALCMLQVRALDAGEADAGQEEGVGSLFGALAVLHAVGQMIGPMLFGLIYSETVAAFPKAIFVTAAGILVTSLTLVMLVRGPKMPPTPFRGKGKKKAEDLRRGRSRIRKDLRGGATGYGSVTG